VRRVLLPVGQSARLDRVSERKLAWSLRLDSPIAAAADSGRSRPHAGPLAIRQGIPERRIELKTQHLPHPWPQARGATKSVPGHSSSRRAGTAGWGDPQLKRSGKSRMLSLRAESMGKAAIRPLWLARGCPYCAPAPKRTAKGWMHRHGDSRAASSCHFRELKRDLLQAGWASRIMEFQFAGLLQQHQPCRSCPPCCKGLDPGDSDLVGMNRDRVGEEAIKSYTTHSGRGGRESS